MWSWYSPASTLLNRHWQYACRLLSLQDKHPAKDILPISLRKVDGGFQPGELPKTLSCGLKMRDQPYMGNGCYDLILATLLCSPPCHDTPFPSPLHPVLAHSCISCTCYLSRVHIGGQPLATWLRNKDVEPPAPLTPYQGGAAACSPGHLNPYHYTQEVQSFTPGQLTPYRYTQEVHDHLDTSLESGQEDIWASLPLPFLIS